jgi:hypothetical protein
MTVRELPEFLKQHWPTIREQLLTGTYKPQPVRRVLQRRRDRTFSDHSYGSLCLEEMI